MRLAQYQIAMSRLYTDDCLRDRFYADPAGVGAGLGLTPDEAGQLARLSVAEVDAFAGSLKRKRLNEARKQLPLTSRALGPRFGILFLDYAAKTVPSGPSKHRADAIGFVAAVQQTVPKVAELARYEAACVMVADPTRRLTVRFLRGDIRALVQGRPAARRPTLALWFRPSRRRPVRHLVATLPSLRRPFAVPIRLKPGP